jgi:hypothetical protein
MDMSLKEAKLSSKLSVPPSPIVPQEDSENKSPKGHYFTKGIVAQCEQVSPSPSSGNRGLDGCGFVTG